MIFSSSIMKLNRAARHAVELEDILSSYDKIVEISIEEHSSLEDMMVMRFIPPPPSEVPMILGDAVHNLRSCLDLLINDIAELRNRPRKSSFPFAINNSEYHRRLQKDDIRKLGSDVVDILRGLRAYEGGNDDLRGLHDLDIADKHKLIITVTASTFMRYNMAAHVEGLLGIPSGSVAFIGSDGSTMRILDIDGGLIPKDPAYLENVSREIGGLVALFGDGQPFARTNVRTKLQELHGLVEEIVAMFERLFSA